jgi:hypothetical protein
MTKFLWFGGCAAVMLVVGLIVYVYGTYSLSTTPGVVSITPSQAVFEEGQSLISVEEADRRCRLETDCAVVSLRCGDCGGFGAVNKAEISKYESELEQLCSEEKLECDTDWRDTHDLKCIQSSCVLSAKSSK